MHFTLSLYCAVLCEYTVSKVSFSVRTYLPFGVIQKISSIWSFIITAVPYYIILYHTYTTQAFWKPVARGDEAILWVDLTKAYEWIGRSVIHAVGARAFIQRRGQVWAGIVSSLLILRQIHLLIVVPNFILCVLTLIYAILCHPLTRWLIHSQNAAVVPCIDPSAADGRVRAAAHRRQQTRHTAGIQGKSNW